MPKEIQISAGDTKLTATLLNNATVDALVSKFPVTLPMLDRYDRELVYRFRDALPAHESRTSGYRVGEIAYWTPRHSFVIFYAQNGEVISDLQPLGQIDGDATALGGQGDVQARFEMPAKQTRRALPNEDQP